MEFIDKSIPTNVDSAHHLIDSFLSRCKNGGFSPDDDLYQKMKSDKDSPNDDTTYNILRHQLLQESNNRCCYCMRNLDENHTTLEHVIPNKASQQQYNEYQQYYAPSDWSKIIYATVFLTHPRLPSHRYPHTIAYENLIPSCNGKFAKTSKADTPHPKDNRTSKCCNNKRGNDHIIPFMFDPSMVSQFKYNKNGYVVWPVDSSIQGPERKTLLEQRKQTIDNLGLNCPELVTIRRIWFFLSALNLSCDNSERDRTIFYLSLEPNLTQNEEDMLLNFWQDNYWSLLKQYNYFSDANIFNR